MLNMLNSAPLDMVKSHNPPSYDIYIYRKPINQYRLPQWERIKATDSIKRAIKYAQILQKRGLYEKVEIKKRVFSKSKNKFIGKTICTYTGAPKIWATLFNTLKLKF